MANVIIVIHLLIALALIGVVMVIWLAPLLLPNRIGTREELAELRDIKREIRAMETKLQSALGRVPNREEISAELESTTSRVNEALQLALREVSLDHRVGKEQDRPISDFLVDEGSIDAASVTEDGVTRATHASNGWRYDAWAPPAAMPIGAKYPSMSGYTDSSTLRGPRK